MRPFLLLHPKALPDFEGLPTDSPNAGAAGADAPASGCRAGGGWRGGDVAGGRAWTVPPRQHGAEQPSLRYSSGALGRHLPCLVACVRPGCPCSGGGAGKGGVVLRQHEPSLPHLAARLRRGLPALPARQPARAQCRPSPQSRTTRAGADWLAARWRLAARATAGYCSSGTGLPGWQPPRRTLPWAAPPTRPSAPAPQMPPSSPSTRAASSKSPTACPWAPAPLCLHWSMPRAGPRRRAGTPPPGWGLAGPGARVAVPGAPLTPCRPWTPSPSLPASGPSCQGPELRILLPRVALAAAAALCGRRRWWASPRPPFSGWRWTTWAASRRMQSWSGALCTLCYVRCARVACLILCLWVHFPFSRAAAGREAACCCAAPPFCM